MFLDWEEVRQPRCAQVLRTAPLSSALIGPGQLPTCCICLPIG